jgi:tellurite resistance protein
MNQSADLLAREEKAVIGKKRTLPLAPASFFAMTLGLAETGNAWRNASALWHVPAWVGEMLEVLAIVSFLVWIAIYINKWINYTAEAKREFNDPVQASFIALIPESIILIALALLPYHAGAAAYIFWVGSLFNLLYGAYRLSTLWTMEREPVQTTPSLFLTFTASILVNALAAGLFGYTSYGFALLGIGTISWLVMDSAITQQLIVGGLATKTRNFMGIYMAPSVVIFVAYQVLTGAQSNLSISYALAGYAVFIAVALTFALRWLREQPFAPGYWAYTFGIATLSQGLSLLCLKANNPAVNGLAVVAFILTNLVLVAVIAGSVRLFAKGQYFPK